MGDGDPVKVVIADDSSVARRQLRTILEEDGRYEVVGEAANGAEAVKLFHQHEPDLLCLDMLMPVMDGAQALRAVKAADPDAHVVVVTSLGNSAQRGLEVLELGASAVITKPFVDEDVLTVLRTKMSVP